ncbi:hypothetical protein [Sciscionella sediminilitoris]|uniref:hypothetical protein n=1 Tax=Sciscionella sediminilitoris TaxID=1445613 RepID=UPI0004DF7739|nr:hypothetical protein [Sciscionella sp. SE31]
MNQNVLVAQAKAAPARLRAGAWTIAGCALALVLISIGRAATGGGIEALVLPLLLALAQLGAAGAVLLSRPYARILAGALLFLTGLLHLVIALGEGQWWFRLLSALLVLASIAAGVLLAAGQGEVRQR